MNTLQKFIYPQNSNFGSEQKYLHKEGIVSINKDSLKLKKGSSVKFDTYFNAFSLPLWKNKVEINSIELRISGKGAVKVELFQYSKKHQEELKDSKIINLSEIEQVVFELSLLEYEGLIYPKISAIDVAELRDIKWNTSDSVKRSVKLGISVTHFERKAYIIPTISQIKKELLYDPYWKKRIDFTVVDNSQNITSEEANGITVIPNKNTGGSGGFTRGLLYYKNDTDATHVLFMDDDANLEFESIKRAYRILEYAPNDNSAVGADLFFDDAPDQLHERGGHINPWNMYKLIVSREHSDILSPKGLLEIETDKLPITYEGWWFFAFPISAVEKYSIPFLVRGDDITFPEMNDFTIIFGLGIASYGESYRTKTSLATLYLNTRNRLILNTMFNKNPFLGIMHFIRFSLVALITLRWEDFEMMQLAFKHYKNISVENMIENAEMSYVFETIKSSSDKLREKYYKVDSNVKVILPPDNYDFLSIGSGMISSFFYKKGTQYHKDCLEINKNAIGFEKIIYVDDNGRGYEERASKAKTIKYLFVLFGNLIQYIGTFTVIKKRMMKNINQLTSEQSWNGILEMKKE